ncbi:molybdenum cofactor biosynthesis protein B [Glaciecola sp. 1036]|uniref:molybdenum cofactor biosynthesis protein B n=1 Tax=Alteromonadaceae TaxID=72275 RepID=UPI003D035458
MSAKTSLQIAILTISDTRTIDTDTSGGYLVTAVEADGHQVYERSIVKDNIYQLREIVSRWIADENIHCVVTTGGTGFTPADVTPEAIKPLFDKDVDGFGELFRAQSFETIGTSTIQSRVFAGFANQTVIFCLPGSTGACKDGWKLIAPQLDSNNRPCNFVEHITKKHQ